MKKQMNAVANSSKHWLQALPRRQRGAATILTMLLIGVGLISVSMGAMHMVRSTQERQLAVHAQVNSQAGVWATVETVRTYLQTLTKDQLSTLATNQTWTITGIDNLSQTALLTGVVPPVGLDTEFKVSAILTATDLSARSSSSLEVVYEVIPSAAPGNVALSAFLDFYNDLNMSGGIVLKSDESQAGAAGLDFNVDGDFITAGTGVTGDGIRNISVTGNVVVGSAIKAKLLKGRNVKITGGAMADRIEAWGFPKDDIRSVGDEDTSNRGDTCCGVVRLLSWDDSIRPIVRANGEVYSAGSGANTIDARKSVDLNSDGFYTSVSSLVDIYVKDIKTLATGGLLNIHAGNDVTLSNDLVTNVRAGGDVTCSNKDLAFAITAGGTATGCTMKTGSSLGMPVAPPTISLVPEVTLTRPTVDVWPLKDSANYVIEVIDGKVQVTVKNVNGLANDIYYLGTYSPEYTREYLCKAVLNSDKTKCDETVTPKENAFPFCTNGSDYNKCFGFERDTVIKKMTVRGTAGNFAIPTGVIWFNGDLVLETGPYFNTFLATKTIVSSGALVSYAMNFAAAYDQKSPPSNAACKNEYINPIVEAYSGKYPTNYCSAAGVYTPDALGNVALMAGGYDPADNTNPASPKVYSGGLISLTAKNEIFGTVVAGDLFQSSGDTTIHGYVSAAGMQMSDAPGVTNVVSASTVIDLTNLPSTYKPGEIPNTGGTTPGTTSSAKVLWTRYR